MWSRSMPSSLIIINLNIIYNYLSSSCKVFLWIVYQIGKYISCPIECLVKSTTGKREVSFIRCVIVTEGGGLPQFNDAFGLSVYKHLCIITYYKCIPSRRLAIYIILSIILRDLCHFATDTSWPTSNDTIDVDLKQDRYRKKADHLSPLLANAI